MGADALVRLTQRRVEKPWGLCALPAQFNGGGGGGEPIGEIWFEDPDGRDLPLLIKYLFTSERLSIQVHPDDALAVEMGYRRGKDEAWLILDAEPDAVLGIGLKQPLGEEMLRAASLDGSIRDLLDWQPVAKGDSFYAPAGTIHAIGPGLTLLEVQPHADLTFRLYDYGRPRELHLDDALAAAKPNVTARRPAPRNLGHGRTVIAEGRAFTMERWDGEATIAWTASPERPLWLVPLTGTSKAGGRGLEPGSAWVAYSDTHVMLPAGAELVAAFLSGPRGSPDDRRDDRGLPRGALPA